MRTDNDIFKHKTKEEYRFAGIQRAINICRSSLQRDVQGATILGFESKLNGFTTRIPPCDISIVADSFIQCLKKFSIFLAEKDLEHDVQAALPDITASFFGGSDDEEIVHQMQKAKAQNMFSFLQEHSSELKQLKGSTLAAPLERCKDIIEKAYDTTDRSTAGCN